MTNFRKKLWEIVSLAFVLLNSGLAGQIRYVDVNASSEGHGASWITVFKHFTCEFYVTGVHPEAP